MPKQKQKLTKEQAIKVLEQAGLKGDWSDNFTIERFLAWVVLSIEFWNNPPKTLKAALDHDPTSGCLHEAICHNLEAVCIMTQHLKEHCPDHPTPMPPAPPEPTA